MNGTTELQRSLKLWHIVVIGLGYMAPMAVFDTFGIVAQETGGHVPAAYAVTLLAILFTAASYGKMVRVFPSAGTAYTYTQETIHPYAGFLVGWASLLDYLFLPMINALLTGVYLSSVFPDVPTHWWIVGFILLITLLNVFRVTVTASVNSFLVLFQISVVVVFAGLAIRGLMGGGGIEQVFTVRPFFSPDLSFAALLSGASILCFSFLGFDAVTTLTEETVDAKKTIPRGIFLVALCGGALFITASYFSQSLFPDASVFSDPEAASAEIALSIGGTIFQLVFLAAALSSTLASGLVSVTSVTRLLYAMGRDGYLPRKWFGYIHPRLKTPLYNVLLVGLLMTGALFLDLLTATSFINFGALIAFSFVNLSVIAHYVWRQKRLRVTQWWSYLLSPLIGATFIGFLWVNLDIKSMILGLMWTFVGFIYLLYLVKVKHTKLERMKFEE
ncbi:APC family permease [Brevibacillus centrosporus]|uniref:Putrescine:proton symporter, AAT family n=1 Tax=Brevibacillus centrosporus TaxID=54910 RepID=A0A1I3UZ09_9BACL|nr:APC family permease [Brevibacillus centrosporus]SFJ88120.1 putrescine:proton symporter, AAT family [Brevibacillus centrosporus]